MGRITDDVYQSAAPGWGLNMAVIISRAPNGRGLILSDRITKQSVLVQVNELLTVGSRLIQEAELMEGPHHDPSRRQR